MYMHYVGGASWHPMARPYSLQNACLTITLFPALLQRLVGVDPTLFYKLYHLSLLPLLPVVVYFLAKQFIKSDYALACVLFVMAQTAFLQSPSMARTNIALLIYCVLLLALLKSQFKYRPIVLVIASVGLTLAHYSTSYLSLLVIGSGLLMLVVKWLIVKGKMQQVIKYAIPCVVLFTSIIVWHGVVNSSIQLTIFGLNKRITYAIEEIIPEVNNQGDNTPIIDEVKQSALLDLNNRDKVTRAAFGQLQGDESGFKLNWWHFGVSWLSVLLLSWGLFLIIKRKILPLTYRVMAVVSYVLIVAMVVTPYISQGYGIERIYYHGLMLLGVCFIIGCSDIAQRVRVKPIYILFPLVIALGSLNYFYGLIPSIQG